MGLANDATTGDAVASAGDTFSTTTSYKKDSVAERLVRTRNGCLNCRRRRRKCDELKPTCTGCRRRGEACERGVRVTFRSGNAHGIEKSHPSMRTDVATGARAHRFQIRDVTAEVIREYEQDMLGDPDDVNEQTVPSQPEEDLGQSEFTNLDSASVEETNLPLPMLVVPQHRNPSQEIIRSSIAYSSPGNDYYTPIFDTTSPLQSRQIDLVLPTPASLQLYSNISQNESPASQTQDAASQLLSLHTVGFENTSNEGIPASDISRTLNNLHPTSPTMGDNLHEDDIFLPGSTYQQLHNTLRDHIINTASRNSPVLSPSAGRDQDINNILQSTTPARIPISQKPPDVDKYQEYILWKNYVEEVAPWLDKFDNERHFQHRLPLMAKSYPHLRYSILALSARQMERKDPSQPSSGSLALYQEAIHLLLPQLQTKSTTVIASCVVLCVLEMLSCSPKEWRRHLDGCASLLEAVGINGFVSGLDQALFWCFARMDVCGGLISSERTLIPMDNWASKLDLTADIRLFRTCPHFDMYANYAVFLCGRVLELLDSRLPPPDTTTYAQRWHELFGYIEDWYRYRPEEMKSIMYIPADEKDCAKPFPTVLFGNGSAVSGNQLYHTAALLMLQRKPLGFQFTTKPRSILWHARQICAISISNAHHGCWTNSIQPLWIAGRVMSHPSEHRAIIDIYRRIERETGWGTKWRIDDLREYWGNLED